MGGKAESRQSTTDRLFPELPNHQWMIRTAKVMT
jgi:hypothetical protein